MGGSSNDTSLYPRFSGIAQTLSFSKVNYEKTKHIANQSRETPYSIKELILV